MDALNFSQQDGLFDPDLAQDLILLGAGAVGSHAALMAAKLGCRRLTVYDHDVVSSHNVPMSAYGRRQVGALKVHALRDLVFDQAGAEVIPLAEAYATQPLRGSVLCCVDTMEARQAIWTVVRENPLVDVLIDTRIEATYGEVYCVHPHDPVERKLYEAHLADGPRGPVRQICGRHGIAYLIGLTAAYACYLLAQHWKGERADAILRFSLGEKPFLAAIDAHNRKKPPGFYVGDRLVVDLDDPPNFDSKGET